MSQNELGGEVPVHFWEDSMKDWCSLADRSHQMVTSGEAIWNRPSLCKMFQN